MRAQWKSKHRKPLFCVPSNEQLLFSTCTLCCKCATVHYPPIGKWQGGRPTQSREIQREGEKVLHEGAVRYVWERTYSPIFQPAPTVFFHFNRLTASSEEELKVRQMTALYSFLSSKITISCPQQAPTRLLPPTLVCTLKYRTKINTSCCNCA